MVRCRRADDVYAYDIAACNGNAVCLFNAAKAHNATERRCCDHRAGSDPYECCEAEASDNLDADGERCGAIFEELNWSGAQL